MLTKKDTLILKGLGILIIVLHNFMHRIKPVFGENEFYFDAQTFVNYYSSFISNPQHFIQYFFSYFGHYGVQIFIFLSGYGLLLSYDDKEISFFNFIKKRLIKIYPVFIIAVLMVVVFKYIVLKIPFNSEATNNILITLSLISNWIPEKWYVLSGPFWFYSMIVQLYILFYLIVQWTKKSTKPLWLILVLSYMIIFISGVYFESIKISLYLNFMGNLPVFVLGMILAKSKFNFTKTSVFVWLLFVLVFILGQLNNYFWYISQALVVMIFIPLYVWLKSYVDSLKLKNFLLFTGQLSMYLFAVNGLLRAPWFYLLSKLESQWYPYLLAIAHFIFVYIVALIVRMFEQFIISYLIPERN
ncbi:acyltransferase [Olleya sp. YSTF-M6]|uniref:Acyltransferase n=1 Tax=Olleya sediminilitoris TaxID=2795739 RepID=A0ABS1WI18_9FLAO|nr:acyltransferase [Olleya sediminilitoris]MBL7558754.1 acyltransferase [Olleya sediminilitoris]